MRNRSRSIVAFLSLALGGFVSASPGPSPSVSPAAEEVSGWIAEKDDNICGIFDLKKISNPAKVDYDELLASTEEMKKLKQDKIDPESPKGKQLRKAAADSVTKASETVRKTRGNCSVWKAIRHRDGRVIADLTRYVKEKL
jgi:hypothetical protein